MSRYCAQCGKSKKACICQWIQPLDNATEVIILQHPSEVNRPLGTARILNLSLKNSDCYVGEDFSEHEALNTQLSDLEYQHLVVYPSEESVSLVTAATYSQQQGRKLRLILLDGTWKKAYKMWKLSKNLHSLQSVKLPDELIGHYTIRKAPSENSLSTVEAGFHALTLIEPNKDFTPLLDAFQNMIDFQIAQMPSGVFERNYQNKEA